MVWHCNSIVSTTTTRLLLACREEKGHDHDQLLDGGGDQLLGMQCASNVETGLVKNFKFPPHRAMITKPYFVGFLLSARTVRVIQPLS